MFKFGLGKIKKNLENERRKRLENEKRERERLENERRKRLENERRKRLENERRKRLENERRKRLANERRKRLANERRKRLERKRKLEEERKKLNDTIKKCKSIFDVSIPKFTELISVTKENIAILKNKRNECLLEYKNECSTNLDNEYLSAKNAYNNAKLNLTTLNNEYNIEECPPESCQPLENNVSKLDNMFQRKTRYLEYSQVEHKECLKINTERCNNLLQDLKNVNDKTITSMQSSSNNSEGFTNNENENKYSINKIQTNNQNMKNIQNEIRELEKQDFNLKNPSSDTQSLYYRETNKNILLSTIGCVFVYYLFFEM